MSSKVRRFATVAVAPVLALAVGLAPGPVRGQAEEAKLSRKRVAVLPFSSANPAWRDYGRPVSDAFVTALLRQGVDVIERQEVDEILKEQEFSESGLVDDGTLIEIGKINGVERFVKGTLSEFKIETESTEGTGGKSGVLGRWKNKATKMGVKYSRTVATVKVDFRVINTTTGKVEKACAGEGRQEEKGATINDVSDIMGTAGPEDDSWQNTLIGEATRQAMDSCAVELFAFEARVTLVRDNGQVLYIDRGSNNGVSKGDRFEVERRELVRDDKGEVVFVETEPIGTAEVLSVQENGSKARMVDVKGNARVQQGDILVRPNR